MKVRFHTRQAALLLAAALALPAFAKLPAPTPEAKAKADEAAAKTAHAGKVDSYKLCKSMEAIAANYQATAKKAGKDVKPPVATPPCADPGPFAYAPPSQTPPLEAAGAHSPPKTAASPPSTLTPAAQIPAKK